MRQAGRYLPQYKKVRAREKNFMNFCFNNDMVTEVTLQPIDRFGFDAAIIFSDILVIPHTLGQRVDFIEGVGPVLEPLNLDQLSIEKSKETLQKVYSGIRQTRAALPPITSLFGFVGTPWTVGAYMINCGKINNDANFFEKQTETIRNNLFKILTQHISDHLIAQIDAGCDIVQIFDSWAELCPENLIKQYILDPLKTILSNIRKNHPTTPIMYYGRGIAHLIPEIETWGFENLGFGLDETVDMEWAMNSIKGVTQGNFSSEKLITGDFNDARTLKQITQNKAHIFNLGHGIKPPTPVENVDKLLEIWRG